MTTDPARAMPPEFPLALADRLRAAGVVLVVDEQLFVDRRRRETVTELEGIRRAAQVATAAMGEAATMLREAMIDGNDLVLQGELLRAEAVRARIREVCARGGAPAPQDIMIKPMGPGDWSRPQRRPPPGSPSNRDRSVAPRRTVRLLGGHDADIRTRPYRRPNLRQLRTRLPTGRSSCSCLDP